MAIHDDPNDSVPDRGQAVFAVTVATLVVGTFFFAARIVCRAFIVRRLSWDDYCIVLAWLLAAGLTATIDVAVSYGLGRHDEDIPPDHRLPLRRTEYVFSVLYNPALMALKTSILVFYLRLSKNTQQVLRIASWVVLAIVNVAGITLTLLNIFQCHPVRAAFSATRSNAQCLPLLTEFLCSSPVNIVTDLAILALPIPVLTGMRLPRRQKYILVFTFSLGIFVTVVDVVRIYYLQGAISTTSTVPTSDPNVVFGDSPDFAWNASLSLMWSAVEVNVGLICACIPTLKPLIIKILPAVLFGPDGARESDFSTYGSLTAEKVPTSNGSAPPQAPLPAARRQSEDPIALRDFLATAPPGHPDASGRAARHDKATYFGFVNMQRPKSMIETSQAESVRYCLVVGTLFLLWGFSYGLLNTLNTVIAGIADMTTAETIGLTSAYFGGGYFFGPLVVGEWVLRRDEHSRFHHRRHKHRDPVGGFKATFMLGLCIYGIGTIMFWPSVVLISLPGFVLSNFVTGAGLAVLETAANPFLILCGPPAYAEVRILVAQGFQGVATVLSGVLAQKVFFVNLGDGDLTHSNDELIDVQWTYLAITLFCVALALFFYYMPLPEVRDADLGRAAKRLPVDATRRTNLGGLQLRTVTIILAVLAQWTYVAAQESMSIFLKLLLFAPLPGFPTAIPFDADHPAGLALSATDYRLLAHAAFSLSRFHAAHLALLAVRHPTSRLVPSPRTVLAFSVLASTVLALVCVVLRPVNANLVAIPVVLFFWAEGPIWPLVFALGLRGQGDRTKRAAAWLTMGASGPAVWPFAMYGVLRRGNDSPLSVRLAFLVVFALLLLGTLGYPLFLTFARDARRLVDPSPRGEHGERGEGEGESSRSSSSDGHDELEGGQQQQQQKYRPRIVRRKSSSSTTASPLWDHAEGMRRDSAVAVSAAAEGGGGMIPIPEEQQQPR